MRDCAGTWIIYARLGSNRIYKITSVASFSLLEYQNDGLYHIFAKERKTCFTSSLKYTMDYFLLIMESRNVILKFSVNAPCYIKCIITDIGRKKIAIILPLNNKKKKKYFTIIL